MNLFEFQIQTNIILIVSGDSVGHTLLVHGPGPLWHVESC